MSLPILNEVIFMLNVNKRDIFKAKNTVFTLPHLFPYKIIEINVNLYLGGLLMSIESHQGKSVG